MQKSSGFEYGVKHCLITRPTRLITYLIEEVGVSESQAEFLLQLGSVYLSNERVLVDQELKPQDYLRVHTQPRRFQIPDTVNVVFDCQDFVIVDKPRGVSVHASVDNCIENLLFALNTSNDQSFLITHRLDVPTGGLLILARHPAAQKKINSLFNEGLVQKKYKALVENPENLKLGELRHFMKKSPKAPKVVTNEKNEGDLECVLVIEKIEDCEVSLNLITGRTHQIRCQLATEGSPIRGDSTYKQIANSQSPLSIELFCNEMSFTYDDQLIFVRKNPPWKNDEMAVGLNTNGYLKLKSLNCSRAETT